MTAGRAETVIVTGAGGYVGRHVVRSILDNGHDVVAVVRPHSRADVDERARVVPADILDPSFDVRTLATSAPHALVHLAWQDGFAHNAPSHMLQVGAHYRFVTSAAEWGVSRILPLGTMHEVGYWEGAVDADTPTNPLSQYGIAKDALRRSLTLSLEAERSFAWLRCYYIYGDDRNNQSIFTRLLSAADEGRTEFPFTSGRNRYDFIRVEELGRQIAALVDAHDVTGVVNCATGVPVSLAEQVESFIADNDLGLTLKYGAYPDRPYDSPGVWAEASAIHEVLNR